MPHPDSDITVSQLYVYPVKSCKAVSLETASFDKRGFVHDRAWAVVDKDGKVLTQRDDSKMALIEPRVEEGQETDSYILHLSAPGMSPIMVPTLEDDGSQNAEVWGDLCKASDQGEEAALWLSEYLERPVRLRKMHSAEKRAVGKAGRNYPESTVNFQDVYPLLIISEASLNALNKELETPVSMNRFRPNIVVRGCGPYAEDNWRQIIIGKTRIDVVEPCARCVITTIEQETGHKGGEPLKTLARLRLQGNKTMFGQNAIHLGLDNIAIGDSLEVLL